MNDRAILSVGLTQDFEKCKKRKNFIQWLELHDTDFMGERMEDPRNALQHINELEALIAIEKYASLSNMANDMRKHLAEIRLEQTDEENNAYQLAINLVMDKVEAIDDRSQAATSIAEIQSATLLNIATEIVNPDDYQAVVMFAKAINDGCC